MIDRFRNMDSRKRVFVVLCVVLLLLVAFGYLDSQGDVNIEKEEAVEMARPYAEFEPEIAEAKLIRQGFFREPIWAVLLAIPDPEGGNADFLERTTVRINAENGEILQIILG